MKNRTLSKFALVLSLALASNANALLINFDDVDVPSIAGVPFGYNDYEWSTFALKNK